MRADEPHTEGTIQLGDGSLESLAAEMVATSPKRQRKRRSTHESPRIKNVNLVKSMFRENANSSSSGEK